MTIPTYLFVGSKDILVDRNNNKFFDLFNENTTKITVINDYGHLDYCWGTDAHKLLYP